MKRLFTLLLLLLSALSISAQEVKDDIRDAQVYFKNGKLTFETKNKDFKLWFDNRVYVDAAYYMPTTDLTGYPVDDNKDLADLSNYSGVKDDCLFKFSNGVVIRRARFGVKATLYKKWFAELDLDFAYNEIEMKDMFIGYKFNDHYSIKAGNFKEPMSMERLTSSKYLTGMERPMAVQSLAGGRKIGIAGTGWGNIWWASAGIFGAEASAIQKERNRGDDGWGVSGRVAFTPIQNDNTTLHIGGYGQWRTPEAFGQTNRWIYIKTLPESYVDRRRWVRAKIGKDGEGGYVKDYSTLGLELGFRQNKLLVYGEYVYRTIDRYGIKNDQKFDLKNAKVGGWYATASYMILGDQRSYDKSDAEFGAMKMRKGGNLELMARVSTIDVNDFSEQGKYEITGGSAISYSASLNYFPNRNILVGLNYTFMDNDKYADSKGDFLKVDGQSFQEYMPEGLDFGVVQMRLLVSF